MCTIIIAKKYQIIFGQLKKSHYLCTRKTKKQAFCFEQVLFDSLAQLVEHNTFNVGVMGSNPMRVTNVVS